MWNLAGTTQEVVGVLTSDGQILTIATTPILGGSFGGLYLDSGTGNSYYTWPESLGAPTGTYTGMLHQAGYYFIPIVATIHTHNECRNDSTDGITNTTLSNGDQGLTSKFTGIKHYIIGCNTLGTFSNASTSPTVISSSALSTSCSLIK